MPRPYRVLKGGRHVFRPAVFGAHRAQQPKNEPVPFPLGPPKGAQEYDPGEPFAAP